MGDQINNKRIVKNTLFLYTRQIVIMLVSLYTSRVILKVLGVEDFGIYNVVGGVVILFTFLNSSLSNATQRFLNYEMGADNKNGIHDVFCMSINIHFIIVGIVLLLAETVGLWFVNTKLNIEPSRMNAANWAYHFSILSLCLQMLRVPYGATIIAYEKMGFYAYLSILDAALRLGVVCLLNIICFDKLIVYAALIPIVNLCILVINVIYVTQRFETSHFKLFWDHNVFNKMITFSGWSLLGGVANTCSNYGLNIIMNIFCGVVVNAAMGIANQVNAAVGSLVSSFQTAFAPQIVKSYAAGNMIGYFKLITRTSKFSYFILLILTVPIVIFAEPLLKIWLITVPDYTVIFTQLVLLYTLIDSLSGPFWHAANATGNVRNYYVITSILLAVNLPIAYILLRIGVSVVWVVAVRVLLNVVIHGTRVLLVRNLTGFSIKAYMYEMTRYVLPTIVAFAVLWLIPYNMETFVISLIEGIFVALAILICVYIWGLSESEQQVIVNYIKRVWHSEL